jgi:MFS family permease
MEEPEETRGDQLLAKKEKRKIDQFFDDMGYTKYQIFMLIVAIFVFFADGTEVLVITLIMKSLQQEWQLTPLSKSFIASSAFIGLMIGSFIASKLLDIYGRKIFMIAGGGTILIFGYLSSIATGPVFLFIMRLMMGIGIGAQIPATTNLAAESIPSYRRSVYLANMWIAFPVGELYVCIMAMNIMPNFEADKWRTVLMYCLIPVFICFIGSFFIYESTRFYLAHGRVEEAKENMIKLASWTDINLTDDRIQEIVTDTINNPINKYESTYKQLISKRFLSLSINTWFIWFFSSLCLYMAVYMLPQVLATMGEVTKKGNLFMDIIVSNLIAAPKTIIGGLLPEIEILGRKRTMMLSGGICALSAFFILIDVDRIYYYCGLIKLLSGISMAVVKIYSTEAYPTKLRGLGYGTGHSFARLGGVLTPFICEFLWKYFGILTPFFFITIIGAASVYNSNALPFETLGRNLDQLDKEDIVELKQNKDF